MLWLKKGCLPVVAAAAVVVMMIIVIGNEYELLSMNI
jgi:hypothetical protein